MPIKFKCPHCHKGLSVKEQLAGKRAPCPACKQVLTIPAPTAQASDIEALAASALADEPPSQESGAEPASIDFNCPFCDEPVHMSVDLGGKQAPCPECRRIIKVPMPAKKDPTNWRKAEVRGPSLARRDDEPVLEGAWGSTNKAVVSREALEDADAIPVVKEPLTLKQKIKWGAVIAGGLAALVLGWVFVSSYWAKGIQDRAINEALGYVGGMDGKDKLKIAPEAASKVYTALGEMHLLAGRAEEARDTFSKARNKGRTAPTGSFDGDAALLDLAVKQIELGGSATQVENKERLSWPEASRQWEQTLKAVGEPGRATAFRQVCRKVLSLAPEMYVYGLIGLSDAFDPAPKPTDKTRKPRLVALHVALSLPENVERNFPDPKKGQIIDLASRFILEKKPKVDLSTARAFFLAAVKDPVIDRLECLLTVAVVAYDRDHQDLARACVVDAVGMLPEVRKEIAAAKAEIAGVSWLMLEWALLALQTDQGDQAKVIASAIGEPALRGRFDLEKYRLLAKDGRDLDEDSWAKAVSEKGSLAQGLALQLYARSNARRGRASQMLTALDSLEPEKLRPLGYSGVALGFQEQGK